MTDGVQDSVYNEEAGLVKPVVAKMAETFAEGREEGEKSILETVQKYIVGASNASDDASFGVMYFEGTQAPSPDALESTAAKFASSTETFKDLSQAIKPELVNAHEIILKCAGQEVPASEAEPENAKTAETEASAENKEEIKKEPSRVSKISIIILAAGIILCVIGVISLVLSLKG